MTLISSTTANGTQVAFPYDFPILVADDIRVFVGGVQTLDWLPVDGTVTFRVPPTFGALIEIQRVTRPDALVTFSAAAFQLNSDLFRSYKQTLHIAEEAHAFIGDALFFSADLNCYDAKNRRITNVAFAVKPDDVVVLTQLRLIIASAGIIPASALAIAAAILGLTPVLVTMQADRAAIEAQLPLIDVYVGNMALALAALRDYAENPPPFGVTLINRIDLALGQTAWRDVLDDEDSFVTFDVGGTWTKPDPLSFKYRYVKVETFGAGAAGLSFNKDISKVETGFGAAPSMPGGGGGAYNKDIFLLASLPNTVDYTVGIGGDPAGTRDGGSTAFGSYVFADGGKAPTTPLKGGQGGFPMAGLKPVITLPDGRILGDGGQFTERGNYISPALLPTGGIFHGGGGGSGHGNNPNKDHIDPALEGGVSLNGGGGGGGGYTARLTAGQDTPQVREIAGQYFTTVATGQVILVRGPAYTSGPFVGIPRQRYIVTTGFVVERPATLAAYVALLATGQYAGYGLEGDRRGNPKTNYIAVKYKASGSTDYLLPGKGGHGVGKGGDGGGQNAPGRPGQAPGGGGGGAGSPPAWYNSTAIIPGGLGANGRIKLTYF